MRARGFFYPVSDSTAARYYGSGHGHHQGTGIGSDGRVGNAAWQPHGLGHDAGLPVPFDPRWGLGFMGSVSHEAMNAIELVLIALAALLASGLTFFSGFGLGTLLTPVFMVVLPAELAVALTGVVHLLNNLFKLVLVGRAAAWPVVFRFGIPAVIGALVGAAMLTLLADRQPICTYVLFSHTFTVFPLSLVIALLLVVLALFEFLPAVQRWQVPVQYLPWGGALSGFMGGLSGNQGALRTAFLIRAGLSKEAFIGTAVVVSTVVDFSRLGVYASRLDTTGLSTQAPLLIVATGAALAGALLGHRLLKKVTLKHVQKIVAVMLLALALALGAGWL